MAFKKCKMADCFEPSDCRHGYCHKHCHAQHQEARYNHRSYPRSAVPHLGVEIEVEFRNGSDKKRAISFARGHGDGSLDCGAEYKVLAPTTKIAAKCHRLLEELWKRRATVGRSTGLHVHIDVRKVNHENLRKAFLWFRYTQDVWFNLMPPSRRHNTFCGPLENKVRRVGRVFSAAEPSWQGEPLGIPSEHYDWVHSTHYHTMEVRIHPGTLNPFKLAAWLAVMAHVQACLMNDAFDWGVGDGPSNESAEVAFWRVMGQASPEAKIYLKARASNGGVLRDSAFAPAVSLGGVADE